MQLTDLDLWFTLDGPVYIAGPMGGLPKSNFPTFDLAAQSLRAQGYEVITPSELDDPAHRAFVLDDSTGSIPPGTTWGTLLGRDVRIVADQCKGIALLPGWERSRGAKLEAMTGLLCGHQFALFDPETYDCTPVSVFYVAEKMYANL